MSKKKGWDTVPDAAAKLGEAQHALLKMKGTVAPNAQNMQRQDFLLFLKRFQEACYSVTISLDKTQKGWRKNLHQREQQLINFMLEQRGTETHNAGSVALRKEMKSYPVHQFNEVDMSYAPALYLHAGNRPPSRTIELTDYYFYTGSGRKEIGPTCDDYLAILARHF